MLPTLRMNSLIEKGRIEIPYYHEFPIIISIADHDFQKSHSRLLIKQDSTKLLVSPKCLFLVPCSKGGQNQFEEKEGTVDETGEMQLPTNDINKAVVVIYLKVIGNKTIDFGSFTDLSATLITDGSPLESVQEKIILSHFYELTIKQLDIFYHINLTNMSEFPITFITQNSSQTDTSQRNQAPLLTGESIATTINSSKEKVFVLFGFSSETLHDVSKELFVDDFAFLGEYQTSKLITENEISKDTILKDSTRINNPKVEIFVDNRSSHCLQNEVLTIDLSMRVLPQTNSSPDQTIYTLLAQTKPGCSYLLLGQTQVYLHKEGSQASWTIQILPFECGVFALPDFEVTEHHKKDLENSASSKKLSENAFILKYYAQPSIAVTSDSSKIKNSDASFV